MRVRSMAVFVLIAAASTSMTKVALAQNQQYTPPGDPAAVSEQDGKNLDAEGNPTYKLSPDGTVDWYTYSGYRRYHSECHVCHGPDGMGSSYAPALADSLKRIGYTDFLGIVAGGRQNVGSGKENVMPAFGTNLNVMCYIDDLYVYLRARAQGGMPRGRPPKHGPKPEAYTKAESECMGTQ
jgi:methanol metabolism-related c-type cytochrome